MAKLRWGRSEILESAKLRWGRSEVTGDLPVVPKLRWGRSEVTGAVTVSLRPFAPMVGVESMIDVAVTAVLDFGSATPDSYVWSHVGGTATRISGTGSSVTVLTPAGWEGATTQIRCTPYVGTAAQKAQDIVITSLPHNSWRATSTGHVPRYPRVHV